jgi:tRNA1(Val) A37 N6-methylase TrmN6
MPDVTPLAQSIDAFLGGRLVVAQPLHGYRAGVDAVLAAAAVPDSGTVLDVGAGVGVIGLCVATRMVLAQVTLLEAQVPLLGLATANIARNGLGQRVSVIGGDILDRSSTLRLLGLAPDSFDHVVSNPPFNTEGQGRRPPNDVKARSHQMPAGQLAHWGRVMARYCRPGGTATMIHRADQLASVLAAFAGRFGAVRVLPVAPRSGTPATRIIVQGVKGSRAPLVLLAGLVLHQPDGHGFTPPVQAILRDGAALQL